MANPLTDLIELGTKLWIDSIDPDLVRDNYSWGASGATSNPIIVANLLQSGRFDAELEQLIAAGGSDESLAWEMTDRLVRQAQDVFLPVWEATQGNDGFVSFELDPLLEDFESGVDHQATVDAYIQQGKKWAAGHRNRMIKIPATEAGLGAIEELVAAGVTLNVTLIFTLRQYKAARDAAWRGAQRRQDLGDFKSVYSIFVSRVDVYTEQHVPELSTASQGQVGIVNAKRIWAENQNFWIERGTRLEQEIIFASTGVKKPEDDPWKYVAAFAGSDIQTNPPSTNEAVFGSDIQLTRQIDQLPDQSTIDEIDEKIDFAHLESVLMNEGIQKFAEPQKKLLRLIADKRGSLASS